MQRDQGNAPTRKLNFSLDQETKKKFLQFLESILSFSYQDSRNYFGFSNERIICNIFEEEDIYKKIAYVSYSVYLDKYEKDDETFKTYCVETSKNQIRLFIPHFEILKLRNVLKEIPNAHEYIVTAKKKEDNSNYLEVMIQMEKTNHIFREVIKFSGLKDNIKVDMFNREACFFTDFIHNHNLLCLLSFLDNLAYDKVKNKFLKVGISLLHTKEYKGSTVSFSLEDKSVIVIPINVENANNYNEEFEEFYINTQELYKMLHNLKTADSFGIFYDFENGKIYPSSAYFPYSESQDCFLLTTYGLINIINIEEKF